MSNVLIRIDEHKVTGQGNEPKIVVRETRQDRVVWNGPDGKGPLTIGGVDLDRPEVKEWVTDVLPTAPQVMHEGVARARVRAEWEMELSKIELRASELRRSVAVRLMEKAREGCMGIEYHEEDS